MALAKPSVGVSATENADRIGAAIDAIEAATSDLAQAQQDLATVQGRIANEVLTRGNADAAIRQTVASLQQLAENLRSGLSDQGVALGNRIQALSDGLSNQLTIEIGNRVDVSTILNNKIIQGSADLAALRADFLRSLSRPGDCPRGFTLTTTTAVLGRDVSALPAIPASMVAFGDSGFVARMTQPGIVATARSFPIEPGRLYKVRGVVQRRIDAADPANDAVRVGLVCLDQAGSVVASTSIAVDLANLIVTDGRREISFNVSSAAGSRVQFPLPSRTRSVRVYVQNFSTTATTDVEVLDATDITDATAYSPDLTGISSRLGQLESGDFADRVSALETNQAAPLSQGYLSRSAIMAAAVAASFTTVSTLGYASPGDGGAAQYRRVASEPAHPFKVKSQDGSWFEASGRRTTALLGARPDNSTDLRAALSQIPAGVSVNVDAPGIYFTSPGTFGTAGAVIEMGPGVRLRTNGPGGSLVTAPGSTLFTWHGGADESVPTWARWITGKITGGFGALDSGFSPSAYMFNIRDDADVNGQVMVGARFRHLLTAGHRGDRRVISASLQVLGAAAADQGFLNYSGIEGSSSIEANTGGSPGYANLRGGGNGTSGAIYVHAAATYLLGGNGGEYNCFCDYFPDPSQAPRYLSCISAVAGNYSRGTFIDALIILGAQGQHVGTECLIAITNINGGEVTRADTTIIGARYHSTYTGERDLSKRPAKTFLDGSQFEYTDAFVRGAYGAWYDDAYRMLFQHNGQPLLGLFGSSNGPAGWELHGSPSGPPVLYSPIDFVFRSFNPTGVMDFAGTVSGDGTLLVKINGTSRRIQTLAA